MSDELLADAFGRVHELVHSVVDGEPEQVLTGRLDPEANTIAWLVWHLTRVEDDHICDVAGTEQVWIANGFHERFGLPFPPEAHGYGHSSADVAKVRVSADLLADYHDAVHAMTIDYLRGITEADLDAVVDERWDPPVTLAVRLVSVISDALQHVGQAAFIKGVLQRTRS